MVHNNLSQKLKSCMLILNKKLIVYWKTKKYPL